MQSLERRERSWDCSLTSISPELARSADRRQAFLLGLAALFLALTSLALTISPAGRMNEWASQPLRWSHWIFLPVWMAAACLLHRRQRRLLPARDPYLLPIALLLTGWGVLLIWRLDPTYGGRQMIWFLVAAPLVYGILASPPDLRWLRRYRYLWLMGGIVLATLTLFLGTHPTASYPRLWLGCCGIYIQPSEPLRLLLLAYLASFLAGRLAFRAVGRSERPLLSVAPLLMAWGLSVALLLVQRDLGTGTLFLGILTVLLYVVFQRKRILLAAGMLAALGGVVGYLLFDIIRLRLVAWLDPWQDPLGAGYQIVQASISQAAGGVFGRGPGMGAPFLVPVVISDFIFAAVAEEWGYVGSIVLVGLFALLVGRGLRVAARARDPFGSILAAGISIAFGMQAVLILGGVTRLLPMTGITLPFVSYGGSSLLTNFIGLGLLLVVSSGATSATDLAVPLRKVQIVFSALWLALLVAAGWSGVVRSVELVARTDNPRRALEGKISKRGDILDRDGGVLATSAGSKGSYTRGYPNPLFAPIVGYDSPVYGQSGLEKAMDPVLRGDSGGDPWQAFWQRLLTGAPPPGSNIRLTLNASLQQAAVGALDGRQGAIVAIDYLRGDVLAIASSPTFDPNQLEEDWEQLISQGDAPLLNRAAQGRYQPGMAIAPFMAVWALQEGLVREGESLPMIASEVDLDSERLTCRDGPLPEVQGDIVAALVLGCPAPFSDLALKLGARGVQELVSGLSLDRDPLAEFYGERAEVSELPMDDRSLMLAGVGQAKLTVTPLQMARAFAALASGGVMPALGLVDALQVPGGDWEPFRRGEQPRPVLERSAAQRVLEWMIRPDGRASGYSAAAISGGDKGLTAWYLGATRMGEASVLFVIVLENSEPQQAEKIGEGLLLGLR